MKNKLFLIFIFIMSLLSTIPAYADWSKDNVGWYWEYTSNNRYVNCWQWLDGNRDGIAECYCFNNAGYIYTNQTTPDGFTVDKDGKWVVNGVVQTKRIAPPANTPVPSYQAQSSSIIYYTLPRHDYYQEYLEITANYYEILYKHEREKNRNSHCYYNKR